MNANTKKFWTQSEKASLGDTMAKISHNRIPQQSRDTGNRLPAASERSGKTAAQLQAAKITSTRLKRLEQSYEVLTFDQLLARLEAHLGESQRLAVQDLKKLIGSLHTVANIRCTFNNVLAMATVKISFKKPDHIVLDAARVTIPNIEAHQMVFNEHVTFDIIIHRGTLVLTAMNGVYLALTASHTAISTEVRKISFQTYLNDCCYLTISADNPIGCKNQNVLTAITILP